MGNILRLGNIKSVDQYLSKVKLTDYSFYELIRQEIILYRESDGLFPGKVDCITSTSGYTSGRSKIFLKSRLLNRKFQTYITLLLFFLQTTKGNKTLRRIQFVHVYPTFRYLQYKVIIQPISSLTEYVSQFFLLTPLKVGEITSEPEAFYIFLLFALAEDELGNMIFPNSSMALRYFKLLENRWEELLFDLENRNISENIQIADDVRITCIISLDERVRSRRIKKLRTEFQKGFHEIVPRIWPTCPSISCISTGAFKEQSLTCWIITKSVIIVTSPVMIVYFRLLFLLLSENCAEAADNRVTALLKELYLGSIPVLGFGHFAAESIYGLNMSMKDWNEEYICLTPINFYEFIPLEDIEQDQLKTYLAHQIDLKLSITDKMYEKSRRRGSVKPCRVWQVSPGTFDVVFDIILALNSEASPMQIKPQKVTRSPEILKYLMSKRI
ncbi:hypothetical protein CHS0354_040855 [Potamilus streckersoni]|uniref:GH3 C-terminal domain-containing protein n=1 Tax=Potamilus streckersoni TaxID=2493646 RepID=A0AAE0SLI3_9BIVA|nr:hypothetical protein CHS0354_040855 [Potamilus streckersoni]